MSASSSVLRTTRASRKNLLLEGEFNFRSMWPNVLFSSHEAQNQTASTFLKKSSSYKILVHNTKYRRD
jgi:hypothetical protein